jgi:hypothetical protein
MMQATDFADRHNLSSHWRLDRPSVRSVLGEGEVGSSVVVVREVASQEVAQVTPAQDQDMVETLSPDRADEPFREGILPRAAGGREDLLDPHALHASAKGVAEDGIAIAEEISGCGVVREGIEDLLGGPRSGGMLGDVEEEDATPIVGEDDKDEEHAQLSGGDGEEVDGDQESAPAAT